MTSDILKRADFPHVTYWTVNNAARGKTFGV
jgi:hypothetical protein